ncbi:IS66 family insertion sequence element accessory protein TnpB [Gracilibacillus salinarum]|uniref:IS66 family insertion sequence element accessory protein TnpB n=1 Tax=Gracilibacillus salinarum TaxID=2932255 RepID=A0ABY4GRZ2_9BACI|nr:IS66 family insertion sequence element accessory protein TnpB [Gracilibacillus salinarum]UOQ86735.1 IS66 family insertion sequence element accessory protein TnpB [Gracilibacillus salinarum]
MIVNVEDAKRCYIVCGKTDMRYGIDSLAYTVQSQFDLDPFQDALFFFCGNKQDRFKALYWDGEGFWLLYKRFENGQLKWPRTIREARSLTAQQVDWLLRGFAIDPPIKEASNRVFY